MPPWSSTNLQGISTIAIENRWSSKARQLSYATARLPRGVLNGRILALQHSNCFKRDPTGFCLSHSAFSASFEHHAVKARGGVSQTRGYSDVLVNEAAINDRKVDTGKQGHEHDDNQSVTDVGEDQEHAAVTKPKRLVRKPKPPRIPPFLRDLDSEKRFDDAPLWGLADKDKHKTLGHKMKEAPFSVAFNLNPYARALAEPVRECNITNNRVPRSCMLDFHIYEDQKHQQRLLLPLTLAVSLIPSTLPDYLRTDAQVDATKKHKQEQSSGRPTGAATHFLNRYDVINSVPEKRSSPAHIGRRMAHELQLEGSHLTPRWRPDMADFVLAGLRKAVMKQLHANFRSKKVAENIGPYVTPPGGDNLYRLEDIDDVVCVLKLKLGSSKLEAEQSTTTAQHESSTPELDVGHESPLETPFGIDDSTPEIESTGKSSLDHLTDGTEQQLQEKADFASESLDLDRVSPAEDSEVLNGAPSESSLKSTKTETQVSQEPGSPQPGIDADSVHLSNPSLSSPFTRFRRKGHWSKHEEASFLGKVEPLPPPRRPSTLYYPTIPYRNRRIPIYNLPQLLGEMRLAKLLEGTCFVNRTYIAMRVNTRTLTPHGSLLKLQAYLARQKSETPVI